MLTFARYLDRGLFNVFVAAYFEGGSQEDVLQDLKIEYVVSNGKVESILNFIREKKIDIVHIHRSGATIPLETEIIKGIKKINKNIIILEKNVFGKYDPVCFSDIDCSFFQSMMHINERFLPAAGIPFSFERMKVFYNMVDAKEFEKYRLTEDQIADYRARLGIRQFNFVLGKIGRPHIAKWSDLILDMMPYLIENVPNAKFILIGVPQSRIKRINRSKLREHFIILPETSDEKQVHSFYQAIDVLAHSSKIGECNGNTINEAMYWEKPVVVNSTPRKDNGQLEQVLHMENGIVANYPQTYARAIAYLAKNPQKRLEMGKSAFNRVKKINDPVLMTKRLEKIFLEKMLEKKLLPDELQLINDVEFHPSEQEIINYSQEYNKRIKWGYGTVTKLERFLNASKLPKVFYLKSRDFIEHRLGI